MTIRVMSFNVRFGTADDGPNHWDARRTVVFDILHETTPDIVGLQEALAFQLGEIAEACPGYAAVRGHAYAGKSYAAILYRSERFTVREKGCFWLSDAPDEAGPRAWDAAVTRCCTWARFEDFVLFNTHFDHRGTEARVRSARLVADRIRSTEMPRIVVGDLNTGQDTDPVDILLGAGLRDTYREANPRDRRAATYHAFRGRTWGPRIDYVLCDDRWDVDGAEVVRTNRDGRYPSDHYPVMADLRRREQPGSD